MLSVLCVIWAGVSNFDLTDLVELMEFAEIKPAVVQRHSDILSQDMLMQKYCRLQGIQYVAYSSLGTQWIQGGGKTNPVLTDSVVNEIAAAHNRSPAQVVLRWGLQHGQVCETTWYSS